MTSTRARSGREPTAEPGRLLRVGAGSLFVADEGAREAPPVLLLHGFTGSHASFASLREALSGEHRVLSVDLPGHGATRVPPAAFAMPAAAALLLEALDALGVGTFSLLGYSMGGRLAIALALEARERVTALVLESASPGIEDEEKRAARREADEALARSIEEDGVEAFVDRWEHLPLFASLAELSPGRRRRLREERLRSDASGLAKSLRRMGTGSQPWLGDRLHEITAPTLVVNGGRDTKFDTIAARMAASIPDARRVVIPGAGHVPHLERPEELHRAVSDFLRSLQTAGPEESPR